MAGDAIQMDELQILLEAVRGLWSLGIWVGQCQGLAGVARERLDVGPFAPSGASLGSEECHEGGIHENTIPMGMSLGRDFVL